MKRFLAVLALGMILFPVAHTLAAPFAPYWPSKEKPILPCSGFYDQAMDPNQGTKLPPCQSLCDFFKLGQNLLNFAYTLLFFVVVPLSFLAGGVMYMLSGPNPGLKKKGNEMMKAAVSGLVVVLVAYAAVNTFFYLLGPKNGASGWGNLNCSVAPQVEQSLAQLCGDKKTYCNAGTKCTWSPPGGSVGKWICVEDGYTLCKDGDTRCPPDKKCTWSNSDNKWGCQ